MTIPAGWGALGFTSGRRTYKGNKLVGGVSNSDHLLGHAADFTAPISVLRKRFPNNPILDEGDHRHVSGLSDVPYYGRNGTAGLVDGVDTSAPKATAPMMQPRKPNFAAMSQIMGGVDPLAPTPNVIAQALQQPMTSPSIVPMQQPMPGEPPKHSGRNLAGLIMGALGDAMAAYGGQRGVYAPFMLDQMSQDRADSRFQQQLQAKIEADRQSALAKAQEPPQFVQNLQAYMAMSPEMKQQYLGYLDATQPIAVSGPMGTSRVPRSLGGPNPGTVVDGYVYQGGDPNDPNNWRAQ